MAQIDLRLKLGKGDLLERAVILAERDHGVNPGVLGLNTTFQHIGVPNTTVNELMDLYPKAVARAVARIGFDYNSIHGQTPDTGHLARVVYYFGEEAARRLVINQGQDPISIATPPSLEPKYKN